MSTGRITLRLTPLGWLFIGISIVFFISSASSQSALLLVPVGILAGCYVINFWWAGRSLKGIAIHPPRSVHFVEGHRAAQSWRITVGSRRCAGVEAVSDSGVLFRIGCLEKDSSTSVLPDVTFLRRGVFELKSIRLKTRFPFGFAEASRGVELKGEVVVHPAVYPVAHPRAAGFDVMVGGRFRGSGQTIAGDHFSGVRPQQPGDSLRQIHWASSAKGLGLMVKTYDEELSGRVAIIVDGGSSGSEAIADDAVRAAGSLAFAALDAGHHVELADLATLEREVIPPFDDGHDLLDRLTRMPVTPGCLTADSLAEAVGKFSGRSAVHLVLTEWKPLVADLVDQLLASRRLVSIYLPTGVDVPLVEGVETMTFEKRELFPAS
mgnify:CR=1 FL=1